MSSPPLRQLHKDENEAVKKASQPPTHVPAPATSTETDSFPETDSPVRLSDSDRNKERKKKKAAAAARDAGFEAPTIEVPFANLKGGAAAKEKMTSSLLKQQSVMAVMESSLHEPIGESLEESPKTMEDEAREGLPSSIVHYEGEPVGTLATDQTAKPLNSNQMKEPINLDRCMVEEILILLPFPRLNQMRFISPCWNKWITDQAFVERVKKRRATEAIICLHNIEDPAGPVFTLTLDPLIAIERYNPMIGVSYAHIIGSANDMVLFGDQGRNLYIINQTDKTMRRITDQGPESEHEHEVYGIGFDQAEGYMIVRVHQTEVRGSDMLETSAFIYSYTTNSWRTKLLGNLQYPILKFVGFLNRMLYFWDRGNLLALNMQMSKFLVIELPEILRDKNLSFSVARELLSNQGAKEVLLIYCPSYVAGVSRLMRLSEGRDKDIIEKVAEFEDAQISWQPLCYLNGDSNKVVALEDGNSVVVYNVAEHSKSVSFHQDSGLTTDAIGFYYTTLPSLIEKQAHGTKTKAEGSIQTGQVVERQE